MKSAALPTWDLSTMYSDLAGWQADFDRIKPLAEKFAAFRGRLAESPAVLRGAIEASDELERVGEKVYAYASLKSDEDTSNNANRSRTDKVEALFASLSSLSAWFEPEVMAIPDARMAEFLASEELKFYRPSLLELLREKPHVLSESEERLLGEFSDVLGTPGNVFELLNDADLRFGKVRNGEGKLQELTHGNYRLFLECGDRQVRRAAYTRMYRRYGQFRNSFAATLSAVTKRHATGAKVRHYPSSLAASLSGDNIPEEVYRNLIECVHRHLPDFYCYMTLRKEALGLSRLAMYDIFAPLRSACHVHYTFPQAAELVRRALKPLGDAYCRDLERAFLERWIDAPERPGKRSGAYSGGCYDSNPYVLMNFTGALDDVFTLIHELGHSMHSYYSRQHQHYHYADYSLFVAEVASTTNEMLLFHELLKNAPDDDFRAYLTAHLLDEIRGTVFRQTMFAEFELLIHEACEEGTPLSADTFSDLYGRLNALYYGPEVEQDKHIALEWARIPHFYYDFYVYKYATGMSAAIQLAEGILSGDTQKRDAYLRFLSAGDTKEPLELLRDAGVDLLSPAPVEAAMKYFNENVRTLEKLLKKEKSAGKDDAGALQKR